MKCLNMRSKSETARGKYFSSLFSKQQYDGLDLVVNIKQREVIKPDGVRTVYTDVIIMLEPEVELDCFGLLKTPFGPICLMCRTSDYIKNDYMGEGFSRYIVSYTCTRCGSGISA